MLRTQYPVESGGGHDDARLSYGVVKVCDSTAVVLGLDQPHGVEIDNGDARPEVAGAQCDPLAHGPEPDHHDLATVEREPCNRGERRPGFDADVMTVVDEVLQGDPVPVQHWERDVDSA